VRGYGPSLDRRPLTPFAPDDASHLAESNPTSPRRGEVKKTRDRRFQSKTIYSSPAMLMVFVVALVLPCQARPQGFDDISHCRRRQSPIAHGHAGDVARGRALVAIAAILASSVTADRFRTQFQGVSRPVSVALRPLVGRSALAAAGRFLRGGWRLQSPPHRPIIESTVGSRHTAWRGKPILSAGRSRYVTYLSNVT